MFDSIVIVGAGHAGVIAAESLRREGYQGRIVLIGGECHVPYERPPLSKQLLAADPAADRTTLKPESFYAHARIERRLGTHVEAIDPARSLVHLADGSTMSYGGLLLCTGSRPRCLAVPGADLDGVFYLRTADDAIAIRARFRPGARVVIVGGGYIGLEVAATCRKSQLEVVVLEAADQLMSRVVAPALAAFYAAEHAAHGVQIRCSTTVTALVGDGSVSGVLTGTGEYLRADLVVVGVGAVPAIDLAAAAGIACDNGIVVDEHCRTNAERIYAAGDCTSHPSLRYGRRVRLESVDNAFEQARAAAANMAGRSLVHDKVPRFWSDQYDVKLHIAGLSQGYDTMLMRGEPATRSFSACYLREGELIALDAVNSPRDYLAAHELIAERARPDPGRLVDPALPLAASVGRSG